MWADERSTGGQESCSVDGCWGPLGGLVGGGGGSDGASNIMAEYFVDLKGRSEASLAFTKTGFEQFVSVFIWTTH